MHGRAAGPGLVARALGLVALELAFSGLGMPVLGALELAGMALAGEEWAAWAQCRRNEPQPLWSDCSFPAQTGDHRSH